MGTEIEAKLKVDSHEQVTARLTQLQASFLARLEQTDYYFDDDNSTLVDGDRCLRIRSQQNGSTVKLLITYKGAKAPDQFKTRQEIEFEIFDSQSAEEFLDALGYRRALVVKKIRSLWQLNQCEVALDELPSLGLFVEIEGPDNETIEKTQQDLALSHLQHIPLSYACLIQKKLDEDCPDPGVRK